jgi:hypothetical protein
MVWPGRLSDVPGKEAYMVATGLLLMVAVAIPLSSVQSPNVGLAGTTAPVMWKGTSVCEVKGSPCHDESVVYSVMKGTGRDEFMIAMSKVVGGQEQAMGTLDCEAGADDASLFCRPNDYTVWLLRLDKDVMNGTLTYRGQRYRTIHVTRTN